jgi:hypothetical protein
MTVLLKMGSVCCEIRHLTDGSNQAFILKADEDTFVVIVFHMTDSHVARAKPTSLSYCTIPIESVPTRTSVA